MADWYLGSVSWTAVPQFATGHAYSIGDFVRPLAAPAASDEHVFRCTTAGTSAGSESAWSRNNNATTTQGGAVFTCVTGQSTYGWSAPAGTIGALIGSGTGNNRTTAGDRIFAASDHAQTKAANLSLAPATSLTATTRVISVNKAGSVPPVAADYLPGASFATTGSFSPQIEGGVRWCGCTFSSGQHIQINLSSTLSVWLKDCLLWLNNTTASARISSASEPGSWVWENTTVRFGDVGQAINLNAGANALQWFNTPSAVVAAGSIPTTLFTVGSNGNNGAVVVRSVDLSALGTGKSLVTFANVCPSARYTFVNCKLGAAVTPATQSQATGDGAFVELINCDSGNTNYRCERYCSPQGTITTETTITLTAGANDGTTTFSRKMVSTGNVSVAMPLEGFPMDVWNTLTGAAKTATVEIISSGTLTTGDISLQLEYLGDASSCEGSIASSYLANDLTAASNVTASSAVWNASPSTPVGQKLQVAFTPQKVGPVRGIVALRKASTTVYVDAAMSIA